MKAHILRDEFILFADGRFVAQIKVIEVSQSEKFPDGFKVRDACFWMLSGTSPGFYSITTHRLVITCIRSCQRTKTSASPSKSKTLPMPFGFLSLKRERWSPMRANKAMIVSFKDLDDLEKDLLSLGKMKTSHVQSKHTVYFDSIASFRNFMTLQKLEILTMIAFEKPKSIYELTQMLDRGLAPVQKECQMLEKAGFIRLEREKAGRGSIKPRLSFDYDRIVVQFPEHPYELQFKAVA